MLKSPEKLPANKPNKKESWVPSHEEMELKMAIEAGLMKRAESEDGPAAVEWITKYGNKFNQYFKDNEGQFSEMYKNNPYELYALLEEILSESHREYERK